MPASYGWAAMSKQAKAALFTAHRSATDARAGYVAIPHFFLGVVIDPENAACDLLRQLNVDISELQAKAQAEIAAAPKAESREPVEQLTPRVKEVIDYAAEEAAEQASLVLGTHHLLAGFIRHGENGAGQLLIASGVSLEKLRQTKPAVMEVRDASGA